MPLGRIDFVNIPTFEPVPPGEYNGFTDTWEAKTASDGNSTNVEGKFKIQVVDDEGNEKERTVLAFWNLKKEALWRLRQDLVNMGVDPSELNSEAVDLESLLNQVFSPVPTPVRLRVTIDTSWPKDNPQPRNRIASIALREV